MKQTYAMLPKVLSGPVRVLSHFLLHSIPVVYTSPFSQTDPEGLGEVPPEHTKPAISHYLPRKGCKGLSPVPPSKGSGITEALTQTEEGDLQQCSGLSPLGTGQQGKVVLTYPGIGAALRSLACFLAGVGFPGGQLG